MGVADCHYEVYRDFGHPLTRQPGWDIMEVKAPNAEALDKALVAAKAKFWRLQVVWSRIEGNASARLYKPSGAMKEWTDPSPRPDWVNETDHHFLERTRIRIEVMGEVYCICKDCGAKLYSDDARKGETQDRAVACMPSICE
ncbi:hypothetical protein ACYPKM_02095 [Pseudomonas aeruginosa]